MHTVKMRKGLKAKKKMKPKEKKCMCPKYSREVKRFAKKM